MISVKKLHINFYYRQLSMWIPLQKIPVDSLKVGLSYKIYTFIFNAFSQSKNYSIFTLFIGFMAIAPNYKWNVLVTYKEANKILTAKVSPHKQVVMIIEIRETIQWKNISFSTT